jgi:hypothetical protein
LDKNRWWSIKFTIDSPPFSKSPINVFLFTLSGFPFHINLKHLLSISFLYFSGITHELTIKVKIGIYYGHDHIECEKLNWEKKIEKMNNLFLSWSKRNLSILGKVLIIKALIIPNVNGELY